jgi:hypothetical protein
MSADLLDVSLSSDERQLLHNGLNEWRGPARCTEEFAIAMGFRSLEVMFQEIGRLIGAIDDIEPLAAGDWVRALIMTEVVFASDVVGSGVEWTITTGLTDQETVVTLRGLQRKLLRAGVRWADLGGTRPP